MVYVSVACVSLAACAQAPEKIAATDIGPDAYRSLGCSALSAKKVEYTNALENLSADQRKAATSDAWGVFLLGLPWSSMSGNDKEAAISVAKGHLQAIETQQARRGC